MESFSRPESSSRPKSLNPRLDAGVPPSGIPGVSPRQKFVVNIRAQWPSSPFSLGSVIVDGRVIDAEENQTRHPRIREAFQYLTTLKAGDEVGLREKYKIPNGVEIRIPWSDEDVTEPQDGEVAFFTSLLNTGIGFHLPDFICHFLRFFHLYSTQLSLNEW